MRCSRKIRILIGLGIYFLFTGPALAQTPAYRPGELLVRFKPQARAAALERSREGLGVRALSSLAGGRVQQLALPPEIER